MRALPYVLLACVGCVGTRCVDVEPSPTERVVAPLLSDAPTLTLTAPQRSATVIADTPLWLPDVAALSQAIMTAGPGWYAASMTLDDHTVVVHGTRRAVVDRALSARLGAPVAEPVIVRTHGVVEVSVVRDGVAVSVEIDCVAPLTNPLCTEDETVLSWVSSLRRFR